MSLRAWEVRDSEGECGCVLFAETAGKAKQQGVSELDTEFTDLRVKRAPKFDDLAVPGHYVTALEYLTRG